MKSVKAKTPAASSTYNSSFFHKESGRSFFGKNEAHDPFFNKQDSPVIQTKLTIGQPGDIYEQEADTMADNVVQRINNPEIVQTKQNRIPKAVSHLVQTKCTSCEEEEKAQKKEEDEELPEDNLRLKPIFESDVTPQEEEIQRKCDGCDTSTPLNNRLLSTKGSGNALPDRTLTQMESSFGADFSSVRIHTGRDAVQMSQDLHAQAFTHGSDIFFNKGKFNPGSSGGNHLLAHELTHVVQQGRVKNYIQKEEFGEHNLPGVSHSQLTDTALGPDPDEPLIEYEVEHDELSEAYSELDLDEEFDLKIKDKEPSLFIVPGSVSRGGIAKKLTGNERHQLAFEYVITDIVEVIEGVPERAVRMRNYDLLTAEAYEEIRTALNKTLDKDVKWTVNKLKESSINDSDQWNLAERCLKWSQFSNIKDSGGTQYFDKYLNELHSRQLIQPHWYTFTLTETKKSALDWLISETGTKSEQIRKAIELRSDRWSTSYNYAATDGSDRLNPGSVVGRFYWSGSGSGAQVRVIEAISYDESIEAAERITRSHWHRGHKVVIPGGDGMFYGYAVALPVLDPLVPTPADDPGGHFYWYYPDTIFIREGEFMADLTEHSPESQQQSREIFSVLFSEADNGNPSLLFGLDYPVLSTATFEERKSIFDFMLNGSDKGSDASIDLLARVIHTTPDNEFLQLERHLSASGLTSNLLASNSRSKILLGQAFTRKVIEVVPFGVDALLNMPTFRIGKEDNTHHMYDVPTQSEESRILEQWDPEAQPRVGAEPALPGEESGPISRETLSFRAVSLTYRLRYFATTETGPVSRSFLPTELVQLEILGPQPQTRIVSAMELALIASIPNMDLLFEGMMRIAEAWMLRGAGVGIGRAFAPSLTGGLAAGGLRGALVAARAHAGTQVGRAALRRFLAEIFIISSTGVVNEYREELKQTAAGRTFLAVFDVAFGVLAARDIYRLARSGILGEVVRKGRQAVVSLSGAARTRLVNALDNIDALQIASKTALERGLVREVAVAGGTRMRIAPGQEETFSNLFFSARAKIVSDRVLTGLSGSARTTARSVFSRLENLARNNPEMARAYSSVARKAESMSTVNAQSYFREIDNVLAARPHSSVDLAGFLRASARSNQPVSFLQDVKWLLGLNGLSDDAVRVLSKKTAADSVDLNWLRTTSLHIDDFNFLASDPMTPWRLFQRASTSRRYWSTLWARVKIRGVSGELRAESALSRSLPGHTISDTQVRMGSSIIDFEIMAGSLRKGMEVKGWTRGVWERALRVFEKRANNIPLSAREQRIIEKMDHLLKQTRDIRHASGQTPILAVSDVVKGDIQTKLVAILRTETNGPVRLIKMTEADIIETGRRIRSALGIR